MKTDWNWKAIAVVVVVIGWLVIDFRADVNANIDAVTGMTERHSDDMQDIISEFGALREDNAITNARLSRNDEAHENLKANQARMDDKLDKIYDLLMEDKR
jgi:hypothetical protein